MAHDDITEFFLDQISAKTRKRITPEIQARKTERVREAWTPERKARQSELTREAWTAERRAKLDAMARRRGKK